MTLDRALTKIYYNPKHPGNLSSAKTLFKYAKLIDSKIKFKNVLNWHQSQETAQLWRPFNAKFKRNPYITKTKNNTMQLDLMDMSNYRETNKSHRYIFMGIDTFSRHVTAYKQKSKSAAETLISIRKLVRKFPTLQFFMTDRGTEFTNKHLKQFLKDKNIHLYHSHNEEIKCGMVERVNRTIRTKLLKLFTYNRSQNWIKHLGQVVKNYNDSFHSSIKMAPNQVNAKNLHLVRRLLYPPLTEKQEISRKELLKKYKIGNFVRVARLNNLFQSKDRWYWTKEKFRIREIINRREFYFRLSDETGAPIKGRFYVAEVLKVK